MRTAIYLAVLFCPITLASAGEQIIKRGEKGWKYLDKAEAPDGKWTQPDFDDSEWKEGQAPLGYGDKAVKTKISFGDNENRKHPVAYFRLTFEVKDPDADKVHYMMIRFDDGVRIHINGKPAGVLHLPREELAPGAYIGRSLGPGVLKPYTGFPLKKKLLVKGKNTIAVAVHQGSSASSDLFLDLELRGMTEEEVKRQEAAEAEGEKKEGPERPKEDLRAGH